EARRHGVVCLVGTERHDGGGPSLRRRSRERPPTECCMRVATAHHAYMTDETDRPSDEPRRKRIFFALWPDDETRDAISRATSRVVSLSGGRATAKRNLHITVAFLGAVD